jgi:hypothetical protein
MICVPVPGCTYLRREVHEVGINPKLDAQVDGPYQILQIDGSTFLLRVGDDDIRVSSDGVTPAPTPNVGNSRIDTKDANRDCRVEASKNEEPRLRGRARL